MACHWRLTEELSGLILTAAKTMSSTMYLTLGQTLADPTGFFWWLNNTLNSVLVLNACNRAGLFALLGDMPQTVEELSAGCGIPPDKLARLLYFLAAEEVITLLPDGRVMGTNVSRLLPGMQPLLDIKMHGMEAGFPLYEALVQGRTSYEVRFGKPVFPYMAAHSELAASFSAFMAHLSRLVEEFVFTQHAFQPFAVAVDIGGNHGGLLMKLLDQYPGTRGILFDLPEVTAMVADAVTSAPLGNKVELVGGDFFQAVPAADLYLLKMILHDWNDAECITILKNIRKVMNPGARVTVIDCVMPETPRPHYGNAMDIAMMVWTTGKERKLSEFKALFASAGLILDRVTENPAGQSVVEAVAVWDSDIQAGEGHEARSGTT